MGDHADDCMEMELNMMDIYGDECDAGWSRSFTPKPRGPGRCPLCGAITVSRIGQHGEFYGCIKYPDCKGSRNR